MLHILASYASKITKTHSRTKSGPYSTIVSSPSSVAGILTLATTFRLCSSGLKKQVGQCTEKRAVDYKDDVNKNLQ